MATEPTERRRIVVARDRSFLRTLTSKRRVNEGNYSVKNFLPVSKCLGERQGVIRNGSIQQQACISGVTRLQEQPSSNHRTTAAVEYKWNSGHSSLHS